MPSIDQVVAQLRGKNCWAVVAGEGRGSMFTLHIGARLQRNRPQSAFADAHDLHMFQGEYGVFAKLCAWRLMQSADLRCTWNDTPGLIETELTRLCELSVVNAVLSPAYDLRLEFTKGYLLELFCDQSRGNGDSYALRDPLRWFRVHHAGEVTESIRSKSA